MCHFRTPFFIALTALIVLSLWNFSLQWLSGSGCGRVPSPCTASHIVSAPLLTEFDFSPPASAHRMDLPQLIAALDPKIEKLMSIGGTAGLLLGVLYKGKATYHSNYGFKDVAEKQVLTEDTIFPGCSLTKALTAATLGLLVEDKKLTWDTLVKDVLPDFKPKDEILRSNTTITDLLCHRTGTAWADNYYISSENNVLIPGKDSMRFLNSQDRLLPFRGQFQYNNLGYEVAGNIIERLTDGEWFELTKSRILDPLALKRTLFKPPNGDNVARCYNALDDATPTPIPCPQGGRDFFGGPSGGIHTTVNDLLKLYSAFISAFNDQFARGATSTEGSPLKQVAHLMSAKILIEPPTARETSYALGCARVQLPGAMGAIGCNPPLMPGGMPIVGKGAPSMLVLYHQGSLPAALACVMLLPETETVIVALTNSLALNDMPDWVAQLVLEEILEVPDRNDYVQAAAASAAETLKWYPATRAALRAAQRMGTSPRNLAEYTGTYWDDIHVFKIVVTLENERLAWAFQGLDSEKFPLTHYEDDVFTWLQPRNELAKRGRWVDQGPDFWKADFRGGGTGSIDTLYWVHDIGVPAVRYTKET